MTRFASIIVTCRTILLIGIVACSTSSRGPLSAAEPNSAGNGERITLAAIRPALDLVPVPDRPALDYHRDIQPLLNRYCVSCHGGATPESDLRLEFNNRDDVVARARTQRHTFDLMVKYTRERDMPPTDQPQPTEAERAMLLEWLENDILRVDCGEREPGRVTVRRLNRTEYANTIRDLLYLDSFTLTDDFPVDDSGYGFDNNGDVLTMSPVLLEQYLKAAEAALHQAQESRTSMARLREPAGDVHESFYNRQELARLILEGFLPRAFRRPVASEEVDRYMRFVRLSLAQDGENTMRAAALAMRAALLSPHFLFRLEGHADEPAGIHPLSEFELATRLSYFLWSSMPDAELFRLARQGELRINLDSQVRRMLQDPKAASLSDNFAAQWLGLRSLTTFTPNQNLYPEFSPELRESMLAETRLYFSSIVREDRSILELIDSNYTFVDDRLAAHYGIPNVSGSDFRKVEVDRTLRGGLLTQASILTVTSRTNRTAPVLRGKWILENILNASPPPPPPDVPSLDAHGDQTAASIREQMARHRSDASCAICHKDLDPLGLAFENFDAIGAWRDSEAGKKIDASGELPDGRVFTGPSELKQLLMSRSGDFRRCFAEKLFVYALGRGQEYYDKCAIDAICRTSADHGDHFSSMILGVVNSDAFQLRRSGGETP